MGRIPWLCRLHLVHRPKAEHPCDKPNPMLGQFINGARYCERTAELMILLSNERILSTPAFKNPINCFENTNRSWFKQYPSHILKSWTIIGFYRKFQTPLFMELLSKKRKKMSPNAQCAANSLSQLYKPAGHLETEIIISISLLHGGSQILQWWEWLEYACLGNCTGMNEEMNVHNYMAKSASEIMGIIIAAMHV